MKSTELSRIMMTAWSVRRTDNVTMSTALRLAWKSYKLKIRMRTEVVRFAFRKIDGTVREAVGTMIDTMVPHYERKTGVVRTPNYTTQAYYDLDRQCFRCYKVSALLLS